MLSMNFEDLKLETNLQEASSILHKLSFFKRSKVLEEEDWV